MSLLEASESNLEEETDRKSETETESKSGPEVCLVLGLGSSSGEGNPSMTVRVVSLMGNAGSTPPFPPQTRECQRPRVLPPPYHDHVHRRPRGWGRCVPSRMRFRHTFARRFQSDPERRCPRPRLQLGPWQNLLSPNTSLSKTQPLPRRTRTMLRKELYRILDTKRSPRRSVRVVTMQLDLSTNDTCRIGRTLLN